LADCAAVTQGVVVDMMQVCSLGVTTGLRIIDLTVEVSGTVGAAASEAGRLAFTDTVGSPPTAIVMVYGGASITPNVQAPAVFTFEPKICAPAAQFTIDVGGGSGAADAEVDSLVTLNFDSDPANPNSGRVQGWSYGVCIRDAAMLDIVDATVKDTDSGTFKGGNGPDFNSINIYPGEGVTHGVVIDLMAAVTLPAQNGWTDLAVTWKVLMDAEGQSTYVVPCDLTLGSPPVANVMVIGGDSFAASLSAGIDPAEDCCNPDSCNKAGLFVYQAGMKFRPGNANGDGKLDLADGIFILNYLYRGGREPGCEAALDANGDGLVDASDAVYIIHWQFLDGPAPELGEECGTYETTLPCDVQEPC
ncbi:MAG: dockerin type I repeat-containing protein, partial [Planctomycetes bacterium]|nr:dockerin type I repeat-containing protein [Planctomycetota bacterium]